MAYALYLSKAVIKKYTRRHQKHRQQKWKIDKLCYIKIKNFWGFPGGAVVGNPPANAGDTGSSPGPGRSHMPRSN